jgi:hypothetical protein
VRPASSNPSRALTARSASSRCRASRTAIAASHRIPVPRTSVLFRRPCIPEEPCGVADADGDGWDDFTEQEWGSDPNRAASTPEHAYLPETCADGVDNDLDGSVDAADDGCNLDSDGDGAPDIADNCPYDANPGQEDADGDGTGDACDYDADKDGWDDESERLFGSDPNNAASTPEHSQIKETCEDGLDNDADGSVDVTDPGCAPDGDFDFVPDASDNCPTMHNPEQTDADGDGTGDACEDSDGDGFFDGDELALGSDPNNAASVPESAAYYETCTDGLDNDLDGTLDAEDEGCMVFAEEDGVRGAENLPPDGTANIVETLAGGQSPAPAVLPAAGARGAASRSGDSAALLLAAIGLIALGGTLTAGGVALRRVRAS